MATTLPSPPRPTPPPPTDPARPPPPHRAPPPPFATFRFNKTALLIMFAPFQYSTSGDGFLGVCWGASVPLNAQSWTFFRKQPPVPPKPPSQMTANDEQFKGWSGRGRGAPSLENIKIMRLLPSHFKPPSPNLSPPKKSQ